MYCPEADFHEHGNELVVSHERCGIPWVSETLLHAVWGCPLVPFLCNRRAAITQSPLMVLTLSLIMFWSASICRRLFASCGHLQFRNTVTKWGWRGFTDDWDKRMITISDCVRERTVRSHATWLTQRSGLMVTTPALYTGDPRIDSWLGYQLSWLAVFPKSFLAKARDCT